MKQRWESGIISSGSFQVHHNRPAHETFGKVCCVASVTKDQRSLQGMQGGTFKTDPDLMKEWGRHMQKCDQTPLQF